MRKAKTRSRPRKRSRSPDASDRRKKNELVVWLLGAGFSKPLGGPLFAELISDKSERWAQRWLALRGVASDRFPSRVVPLFKRGLGDGLWENAEECLAVIDEARLDRVTRAVVAESTGLDSQGIDNAWMWMTQFVAAATAHFVDRAVSAEELPEVWFPYELWASSLCEHDSIVSFNYDRVVEHLLSKAEGKPAALAKLHGTVPDTETLCSNIRDGVAISTIATPGPGKTRSRDSAMLVGQWDEAEYRIEAADRIVIVGYSFPASDAYVRSFILNRMGTKRIDIVVGTDPCGISIAEMFGRFCGATRVRNTGLTAQQYLAEGSALLHRGRFNHWFQRKGHLVGKRSLGLPSQTSFVQHG